jgi:hypothetical protein
MNILDQVKQQQNEHTRAGVVFGNVIQEMEKELQRMKDKKLPQDIIDTRDRHIETLIDYFNTTDNLFQFFKLATLNLNSELKITESLLMSTAQNRELLIDKLMSFKLQRNGQTT